MLNPALVADLATAVGESTGQPATIKCRIGVNDNDSYEQLCAFVDQVATRGAVRHFIVHARRAVLGAKFSPDDNRKIPPLKYDYVYRLVEDFPHLKFTLNGGVQSISECKEVLSKSPKLAGVMVGRACVNSVFQWSVIDSQLYGQDDPNLSRRQVLGQYAAYADRVEASPGGKRARRAIIKPLLGMFTGEPRGRLFRAKLDEFLLVGDMHSGSSTPGSSLLPASEVILRAAQCLKDETLDLKPSDLLVAMEARARQKQFEPGLDALNQSKEQDKNQAQAKMQMQGLHS
jgi:tRNA-dihydrouridine synthase A